MGYQVPQAMHAAMEFAAKFPQEWKSWHETSNSLIVLNAKDERALFEFGEKLQARGISFAEFREPDIGNELTAIAIAPGPEVKKICSNFPLAGKKTNLGCEERLKRKFEVVEAMQKCQQNPMQNIILHGESVRDYLFDLINFLRSPETAPKFTWRFPQWVLAHGLKILDNLPSPYVLEKYALWHDCGKPFCRTVDSEGKVHFENHAKVSASIFRELYPNEEEVARLIEMDMDLHLLQPEGILEFSGRKECFALLLSALAEIHSNSTMFGGINSESFKIKWKRLEQRGKSILKKTLL